MRKIKFYIPIIAFVMAGILSTATSCVDNDESQSVTDIRDAQVEKIKAEADYQKALAESKRILAAAEAAKMTAETKLKEVEIKLKEAELKKEEANFLHETEKWTLEIERLKKLQEVTLAEYERDLATAQFELEQAELQNALAKANLENQLEGLKNNDPVLNEAIANYSRLLGEIAVARADISTKKVDIANAELTIKYFDINEGYAFVTQIERLNKSIKSDLKDIESKQDELTKYNSWIPTGGIANLEAEIATQTKTLTDLQSVLTTKQAELKSKQNLTKDAKIALLNGYNSQGIYVEEGIRDLQIGYVKDGNGYILNYSGTIVKQVLDYDYSKEIYKVQYLTTGEITNHKTILAKSLESTKATLTKKEKEFDDASAAIVTLMTTRDEAKVAYDKAVEERLDAQNKLDLAILGGDADKIAAAEKVRDAKVIAEGKASDSLVEAQNAYTDAQNILDYLQNTISSLESSVSSMVELIANADKALEILNSTTASPAKLEEVYYAAFEAQEIAAEAYQTEMTKATSVKNVLDNLTNIKYHDDNNSSSVSVENLKTWIAEVEEDIKQLQAKIVISEGRIKELEDKGTISINDLKARLADDKAMLEGMEAELAILEKNADSTKKVIDERSK